MTISPNEIQAIESVRTILRPLLIEDDVDESDEAGCQIVERSLTRRQGEKRLMPCRGVGFYVLQIVQELEEHAIAKGEVFFRGRGRSDDEI